MNATKITTPDFLDILFDGRNKNYGAYEHRVSYDKRVRNAIIGTASVALVIIGGYIIGTNARAAVPEKPEISYVPVTPIDPITEEEKKVIPPPRVITEPPPQVAAQKFVTIKIVDNSTPIEEELPDVADLTDKAVSTKTVDGVPGDAVDPGLPTGNGPGGILEVPPTPPVDDKPHTFVEIMPEFPGGEAALSKFLKDNMRYPTVAAENGIQGIVSVTFVVSRTGEISDFKILSLKKGGGLEEEALRVVKKMPKWRPGKQNGTTVPVLFNLPVNFRLQDNY